MDSVSTRYIERENFDRSGHPSDPLQQLDHYHYQKREEQIARVKAKATEVAGGLPLDVDEIDRDDIVGLLALLEEVRKI